MIKSSCCPEASGFSASYEALRLPIYLDSNDWYTAVRHAELVSASQETLK
ncbi:hypothetical protein [Christiangramia gaetbulicola]|nr:hypothetical protein [Christiangramia gaetbulicola]